MCHGQVKEVCISSIDRRGGRPWEMLAVDVLEVPQSTAGNHYLLVVQDYFTKWAEVFPMPDQTAKRITNILISLCARMGLPRIIHSDQGRNFESATYILTKAGISRVPSFSKPCRHLVSTSPTPVLIIHKETEWWNALTDQFFKCCAHM